MINLFNITNRLYVKTRLAYGFKPYSVDGSTLNKCSGWYMTNEKIAVMFRFQGHGYFIEHYIEQGLETKNQIINKVLSDARITLFAKREIYYEDLFSLGWVRFNIDSGYSTVSGESPTSLRELYGVVNMIASQNNCKNIDVEYNNRFGVFPHGDIPGFSEFSQVVKNNLVYSNNEDE